MKLWTRQEPFPWPVAETDPNAVEVPGSMRDGLGRLWHVRYLGPTPPTTADLDAQVNPSAAALLVLANAAADRLDAANDPIALLARRQANVISALLAILAEKKSILTAADVAAVKAAAKS